MNVTAATTALAARRATVAGELEELDEIEAEIESFARLDLGPLFRREAKRCEASMAALEPRVLDGEAAVEALAVEIEERAVAAENDDARSPGEGPDEIAARQRRAAARIRADGAASVAALAARQNGPQEGSAKPEKLEALRRDFAAAGELAGTCDLAGYLDAHVRAAAAALDELRARRADLCSRLSAAEAALEAERARTVAALVAGETAEVGAGAEGREAEALREAVEVLDGEITTATARLRAADQRRALVVSAARTAIRERLDTQFDRAHDDLAGWPNLIVRVKRGGAEPSVLDLMDAVVEAAAEAPVAAADGREAQTTPEAAVAAV